MRESAMHGIESRTGSDNIVDHDEIVFRREFDCFESSLNALSVNSLKHVRAERYSENIRDFSGERLSEIFFKMPSWRRGSYCPPSDREIVSNYLAYEMRDILCEETYHIRIRLDLRQCTALFRALPTCMDENRLSDAKPATRREEIATRFWFRL